MLIERARTRGDGSSERKKGETDKIDEDRPRIDRQKNKDGKMEGKMEGDNEKWPPMPNKLPQRET